VSWTDNFDSTDAKSAIEKIASSNLIFSKGMDDDTFLL